jgi:HK97 family phage prohead protease
MEIRKVQETKREGNTLSGYAVLYNTDSVEIREMGRVFIEQIARGAFDESLNDDIKLYFQHDTKMPLARTQNGSLRVKSDAKGLYFEADLPDTTLANDIKELMNRGILTGEMSFGFSADKINWRDKNFRTVEKGRLYEISVVVDAAYPDTHSQLRGIAQEINQKRINLLRRKTK